MLMSNVLIDLHYTAGCLALSFGYQVPRAIVMSCSLFQQHFVLAGSLKQT